MVVEVDVAGLVAHLRLRAETVATAESLTGGLVVARLIEMPGASEVVLGGLVAYATALKSAVVGVDPALIERVGTIDPSIAVALAQGAARVTGATYGVGTTGVAGPGQHEGHSPGTVHVAAVKGQDDPDPVTTTHHFSGSRAQIREAATHAALSALRARLDA